jgi:hypothetical protein
MASKRRLCDSARRCRMILDGDSFFDGRNAVGIEPPRNGEKHLRFPHFTGNLYYTLVMAVLGLADYEAVFENLILPRRRVTLLQEALVVVERHLNHLHWTLFLRAAKGTKDPKWSNASSFLTSANLNELREIIACFPVTDCFGLI